MFRRKQKKIIYQDLRDCRFRTGRARPANGFDRLLRYFAAVSVAVAGYVSRNPRKMPRTRLKPASPIYNKVGGFTIIELLVVISIMGILMSVIVANIAGQRDHQKLRIAQNEMVTNIRKLQSYTLSSRILPNGKSAQYYILKMDIATPDRYTIQAIYDVMSSPQLFNLETVYFPSGIRLAAANPVVISRPGIIPGQTPSGHTCSLLVFKLPFAKTLMSYGSSGGCVQNSWDPNTDDYEKIVNFVVNTNNQPVSVDSDMAIKISTQDGTITKSIYIDGVTGLVNF